jgi:TPR repeat protein
MDKNQLDSKDNEELMTGQIDFEDGVKLLKSNLLNEGIFKIQSSVKKGNVYGAHQLGLCYQKGIGVEKSSQEAFNWFKVSS